MDGPSCCVSTIIIHSRTENMEKVHCEDHVLNIQVRLDKDDNNGFKRMQTYNQSESVWDRIKRASELNHFYNWLTYTHNFIYIY